MSKKIKLIIESKATQPQQLDENIFKNLLDLVNVFGGGGIKPNLENIKNLDERDLPKGVVDGVPESLKEIVALMYPNPESGENTEAVEDARKEAYENILSELRKFDDPEVLWQLNTVALSLFYANLFRPEDPILKKKRPKIEQFADQTFLQAINDKFPPEEFVTHLMNQIPQGLMPSENSSNLYFANFNAFLLESIQDALEAGLDPISDSSNIVRRIEKRFRDNASGEMRIQDLGVFNKDLPIANEKPTRGLDAKEEEPKDAAEEQPDEEKPEDAAEEQPSDGEQPNYGGRKVQTAQYGNAAGFDKSDSEGAGPDGEDGSTSGSEGDSGGLGASGATDDGEGAQGPGIPIYKFQSRDAAGPDGKRAQPLISKLMKTGLPKSVINTVIKSITKDLKASNVPFYESKEQLTNVLQEHIREVLLGRVNESSLKRSLQKKLEKRQELADKIFKDLKPGETITIDRSDEEELKALKNKYSGLALALTKNDLVDGNYTKTGDGVKFKGLQGFQKGGTKSSLEKKQDNQPGSQLDPAAGDALMTGVEQEMAKEFQLVMLDDGIKPSKAEEIDFAKSLGDFKADTNPESVEKEAEARSKESFAPSTKDAPELWVSLGKSISNKPQVMGKGNRLKKNAFSELNWSTVWSGTPKMQYRDGLGRKEKELWIKMIGSLKASVLSNINYKLDSGSSKDFLTLWQVAMDDESRKEVTKALGQMKDFMKAAVQKQANIRKALAAKLRLKSGKRGGGQIQLSVLNQQLDTISGPGLEGRDSKVVGGKRTPGKQAMTRNKETGKMEPMFTTGPNGERVKVMAGASRRQKSLALKTVQQHLKPYLRQYGLKISEAQETALEGIIVEMYHRFGDTDPQIFGRILKEALSNQGLIK